MKVTISLDFDSLKDDIRNEIANKLDDEGMAVAQADKLLESFDKNIDCGFLDAVFDIELNKDESEIVGCYLTGER